MYEKCWKYEENNIIEELLSLNKYYVCWKNCWLWKGQKDTEETLAEAKAVTQHRRGEVWCQDEMDGTSNHYINFALG